MTRGEATAFINSLKTMRSGAGDELAATAPAVYPAWASGAVYEVGQRVLYAGTLYKVITAHTAQEDWTPPTAPSLFAEVLIPDPSVIPEWKQPDSTNPYKKGDKVSHNGFTWISTADNNVWEPGVYGWDKVEE